MPALAPMVEAPRVDIPIGRIGFALLEAYRQQPNTDIALKVVFAGRPEGEARGAVWIGVGERDAVITPARARLLARMITHDYDWATALPYDPANLANHILAFAARAERAVATQ